MPKMLHPRRLVGVHHCHLLLSPECSPSPMPEFAREIPIHRSNLLLRYLVQGNAVVTIT
ncbi:hypothetical protein [Rubritalea tangerina]|uniref:hypothetical protein n=1 Tax=Rubritalea tangerina TaxID=430798 RepID=UPI0036234799